MIRSKRKQAELRGIIRLEQIRVKASREKTRHIGAEEEHHGKREEPCQKRKEKRSEKIRVASEKISAKHRGANSVLQNDAEL